MRLAVKTCLAPGTDIFIDKPGTIYGSAKVSETLERNMLKIITDLFDVLNRRVSDDVDQYEERLKAYNRDVKRFNARSKSYNRKIGAKAPVAPDRPLALDPKALKMMKALSRDDYSRLDWAGVVIDVKSRLTKQVDIVITIPKIDRSRLTPRVANRFNDTEGINFHVHWMARDYQMVFEEMFRRAKEVFNVDMSESTVRIVDNEPIPQDRMDDFIRLVNEIESSGSDGVESMDGFCCTEDGIRKREET